MPGYYDWKIRNCPMGAITKAESLLATVEAVDPYLEKMWKDGNGSFTPETNSALAAVVEKIDGAEELLEEAKHDLARFFPGHPETFNLEVPKKSK